MIALLTGLVQYPNPYTRFNASQVIRKLFSQCGPEDTGDLWSVTCNSVCIYTFDTMATSLCTHTHTHAHSPHSNYNLTSQSIDAEYHDTQALDGVWRATWQLVLAMAVKGLITIFTFGIKVNPIILSRDFSQDVLCIVQWYNKILHSFRFLNWAVLASQNTLYIAWLKVSEQKCE